VNGSDKRRSIVHEFEWDKALELYFKDAQRADDEIRDWEDRVAQHPDAGYAVSGAPDYLGLPLHTDRGSFLVIYWYDDDHVYCIGMRRVPRGIYGDYYDEND
jgi:hypothetical protein